MWASKSANRSLNALQGTGGRLTKAFQRIRVNEAPGMIQALKSGNRSTIGQFFSGRLSWTPSRGIGGKPSFYQTLGTEARINMIGRNRKIGAGLVGGIALLGVGNLLGAMFGGSDK
jgi:hypothetical protein